MTPITSNPFEPPEGDKPRVPPEGELKPAEDNKKRWLDKEPSKSEDGPGFFSTPTEIEKCEMQIQLILKKYRGVFGDIPVNHEFWGLQNQLKALKAEPPPLVEKPESPEPKG